MRKIQYTHRFKRDYKRELSGKYGNRLNSDLTKIVGKLASDEILPSRCRDHSLSGEWVDCRDCHIKPDLVLIYRKPDAKHIDLVRLGSHSELGL